jgi:hypothetical protein
MKIRNDIALIGDVLGTFPVLQQLNAAFGAEVIVPEEIVPFYSLVPNIRLLRGICTNWDRRFNLDKAFTRSVYMSAAHHEDMGFPRPKVAPKASLNVIPMNVGSFDYVIAPFSRSLPIEQKWDMHNWMILCRSMPDKKFGLFGHWRDDMPRVIPPNLTLLYDLDWNLVCNLMLSAKEGVISVVTGISHLAFHLGVKNYVLTNQGGPGTWGVSPDAIAIQDPIPSLTVEQLICYLQ